MQKLIKEVVGAAYREYKRTTSDGQTVKLREVIRDPTAPALLLFTAARRLLGEDWVHFEPETLWMEFDCPSSNRDKLLAAQLLATYPSFYWDYRIFGHAISAFSHQVVHTESVPQPLPEDLAWGVFEAELIMALTEDKPFVPEFSDEVEAFVGACLHHHGFVLPPENLMFSEEHLDKLLHDDAKELKARVKDAWRTHPETNFDDSSLGVQLARQAEVERVYLVNRLNDLLTRLNAFSPA